MLKFFPSRTRARNYARTNAFKFDDQGPGAPDGERWSVIIPDDIPEDLIPEEVIAAPTPKVEAKSEPVVAKASPEGKKKRRIRTNTKKAQSIKIVNRMLARKEKPSRKVILEELQSKIGISGNCAATYYQNVIGGKWK